MAVPAWRRRFAPSIRGCASTLLGDKMRNILEKARKRDYDEVKAGAQAIYLAESRAQAVVAFRAFRSRWGRAYSAMVRRLQEDLPSCCRFRFSPALWRNCVPPT